MEEELRHLKLQLLDERKLRTQLEDDCDLLSTENVRLHEEIRILQAELQRCRPAATSAAVPEGAPDTGPSLVLDYGSLLDPGDGQFSQVEQLTVRNACHGKNVLACGFVVHGGEDLLVCGGVDNSVSVYAASDGSELAVVVLSAPVLCIDVFRSLVACSCMDGSHAVIDLSEPRHAVVSRFSGHSKYAVSIRWSLDGSHLAVASHDKSVSLYRNVAVAVGGMELHKVTDLTFPVTPEALAFAPRCASDEVGELVIGLRDRPYLLYIDCTSFERREVSLNDNDWDTHVSFTPLFLSLSPDRQFLLVASDKSRHIVYRVGSNRHLRVLGSHDCGDYGKPRVAWDASGHYVYSLSDSGTEVLVYSLATERVVGHLRGHSASVRDVVSHPSSQVVLTVSYDKSLKLWKK